MCFFGPKAIVAYTIVSESRGFLPDLKNRGLEEAKFLHKTGFVKDIFTQKLNPDPQCYPEEYLRKAGHRTLELMERHPG